MNPGKSMLDSVWYSVKDSVEDSISSSANSVEEPVDILVSISVWVFIRDSVSNPVWITVYNYALGLPQ